MKGNWVISSVTYPGSEYIKVNSFQIADSQCFEEALKLVSNNNKGNMALTKYGCRHLVHQLLVNKKVSLF
jgi:hypothetical protein